MELEDAIKNDLKCIKCENYLTCTPIMVLPNGTTICGRCQPSKQEKPSSIRNNAFEKLASAIIFQCRYDKEGCSFKSTMAEIEEHEIYCEYHQFKCPILPSGTCQWEGLRNDLRAHFKKDHSDLLLEHPCDVKPNTTKNFENNMLTIFLDKLFLVQTKYNVSSGKFWYNVRLINDPKLTKHFEYIFEIQSDRGNYINTCDVSEQEFFQIYDDPKQEVDINNLLKLLGRLENLTFKISIKEKEDVVLCTDCEKSVLLADLKDKLCSNCSKIVVVDNFPTTVYGFCSTKCTKNAKGCLYISRDIDVRKHEAWFCAYAENNKCTLCDNVISDMFNHYYDKHRENIKMNELEMDDLVLHRKYSAFLKLNDAMFLCLWIFTQSHLEFKIISNLSKTDNGKYECVLKMINPRDEFQKKYKLTHYPKEVAYDWLANIRADAENPIVGLLSEKVNNKSNKYTFSTHTNVYSMYSFLLKIEKKP